MERLNFEKVVNIAQKFNLKPRIPEPVRNFLDEKIWQKWVFEKNAFVYTFVSSDNAFQLDIFLRYPIEFEDLYKNAVYFSVEGVKIFVSSKKDLIKAKKVLSL